MKRAFYCILLTAILGVLASCGSSSDSGSPTTGIKTRAFVTNSYYGSVGIINYLKDQQIQSSLAGGGQPGSMVLTPDRTKTLIPDSISNAVVIIDNSTEANLTAATLPAAPSSVVVSPDSATAWAATRNAPVAGAQTGAVQVIKLSDSTLGTQIPVPLAQNLALSPDGKKMLVFRDQIDTVSYIDLSATTPAAVSVTGSPMSRPVAAVFSSDGTKAYVADCGAECGGAGPAGVTVIDMTTTPPTAADVFHVSGTNNTIPASTIFLDGSTLYVAGTAVGATEGSLTALTVSGSTLTVAKGPIQISLGYHTKMIKTPDNILFVGARDCPNVVTPTGQLPGGCLSMYNTTTASDVKITNAADGYVTGMAAIPTRNVVYVVEGGELHIYDTRTRAIQVAPCPGISCFIDVFGRVDDVVVVDQ